MPSRSPMACPRVYGVKMGGGGGREQPAPLGHSEQAAAVDPVLRQRFGVPGVVIGVVGLLALVVAGLLVPPREVGLGGVGGGTVSLRGPILALGLDVLLGE